MTQAQKIETTDTTAALPLCYREPVALDAEQHRELSVAPSPNGFAFASSAHAVLLAAVEFFEACREFPIIFAPTEHGTLNALALMGVEQGENLLVDESGTWQGNYVPAYLRRYPFIPADIGAPELPICIDLAFEGLNLEEGQRLFSEAGTPTDYCRQMQAFLLDYQNQQVLSLAFTTKLKELGLLTALDANVQLHDGRKFLLQGLLVVDENGLGRLGDQAVLELFRKGYLGLIYAHLASLKNLGRLMELKAAR